MLKECPIWDIDVIWLKTRSDHFDGVSFIDIVTLFQLWRVVARSWSWRFTSRTMDELCLNLKGESELILGLRPANERRRYFVTTSLIGWMQV